VGVLRQVLLSAYWLSLSFEGGALVGVAIPAQLLGLTSNADKAWVLGLISSITSLVGTAVLPVAGMLSDRSTARWGRRRGYLVGGSLVNVAGLVVMARSASISILFLGLLLTMIGSNISAAAYQAYLPDHVPPEQYGEASGYVGAMMMLGTLGSFGLAALLVAPRAAGSFYAATIGVVAAGVILTAVAIPDRVGTMPPRETWREAWFGPWRSWNFTLVFTTRALMMLALYALFTFVEYYVRDVLKVTHFVQGAAAVAAVATIAAVGGGVLTGWLSDRMGRKPIVSASAVLMGAALLVMATVHRLDVVLGVGVAFGLALGAFSAVDWALAIDVLPSRDYLAKDLGIWGISTNLPQTVAPFLGGAVLALLAPYGPSVGYGTLFIGAGLIAGVSGVVVWGLRGIR
jgi:MFS family permease